MATATLNPAEEAVEVKLLTQSEVDKYIRRDSRLKLLTKVHEANKADIKKRLQGGARCPTEGPFVLLLGEPERMAKDFWKQEALLMLQEQYGEEAGLLKHAEMEKSAPRSTVYQLTIKRNLRYALGR